MRLIELLAHKGFKACLRLSYNYVYLRGGAARIKETVFVFAEMDTNKHKFSLRLKVLLLLRNHR